MEDRSFGVIVISGEPRTYLLLNYEAGHWDFVKGHPEPGEDEMQTATRELLEETGISSIEFIDGFKESLSYFYRQDGKLIHKSVTFFLGRTSQQDVKISDEHRDFAWLPFDEAVKRLTFENAKNLLGKAEEFLKALNP